MSAEEVKAAIVRAPFDYAGVANDFGARKFTGGVAATETTHKADAVPRDWQGQWVELYAVGGSVHYAFSLDASAEVDRAVAATAAGASVKVGGVVPSGEVRHVKIPKPTGDLPNTTPDVYFVRESDTVGTIVYMRLA